MEEKKKTQSKLSNFYHFPWLIQNRRISVVKGTRQQQPASTWMTTWWGNFSVYFELRRKSRQIQNWYRDICWMLLFPLSLSPSSLPSQHFTWDMPFTTLSLSRSLHRRYFNFTLSSRNKCVWENVSEAFQSSAKSLLNCPRQQQRGRGGLVDGI